LRLVRDIRQEKNRKDWTSHTGIVWSSKNQICIYLFSTHSNLANNCKLCTRRERLVWLSFRWLEKGDELKSRICLTSISWLTLCQRLFVAMQYLKKDSGYKNKLCINKYRSEISWVLEI